MRSGCMACLLKVCVLLLVSVLFSSAVTAVAASPEQEEKAKNRVPSGLVSAEAWPGGGTVPKGMLGLSQHAILLRGKAYRGDSRYAARDADGRKVGPKSNDMFIYAFKLRYGLGNGWDIRSSTPFYNNEVRSHNQNGSQWKGGLGDSTIVLRKQVKERTDDSPFNIALDLGVVLPTGHTGDKSKYTATNAWGVVGGGGMSWINYNQRVDWDVQFKFFTEGKHDIRPGDVFLTHLHYAYALSKYFDMGVETWFRAEQPSEVNGHSQRDSFREWYA